MTPLVFFGCLVRAFGYTRFSFTSTVFCHFLLLPYNSRFLQRRGVLLSVPLSAMAVTFDALTAKVGLSAHEVDYVKAKGYGSLAILARAARDDDDFIARVVKPFTDGVTISSVQFKATGTTELVEARLLVLFDEAKSVRRAELAAAAAPLQQTASASTVRSAASLPMLDPHVNQAQIDKWQMTWTPPRIFPHQMIQGADAVLHRLLDEHKVTRFYTPLHLSEIIQSRAHNADGSINLSRVDKPRRDERVVLTTSGMEIEQAIPDPLAETDRWKVYDALVANSWALRWADYIDDHAAQIWTDWLVSELRQPGNLEVFKLFYLTCSWRLALAMRSGVKYGDEVVKIMKDDEWVRKTKLQIREKLSNPGTTAKAGAPAMVAQAPRNDRVRARSRSRTRQPRGPPPRRSPFSRSPQKPKEVTVKYGKNQKLKLNRSRSRNGREYCRQFQVGKCNKKGRGEKGNLKECLFSHECAKCGRVCGAGQLNCRR